MSEASSSDTSGLRRVFAKPDFDVNRFVRNTLRDLDQSTESMVVKLASMSDEASSKMKQAIFDNYKLFIKAGKTATILEATMHQIHNEFAEMEQVMNSLVQLSLFNETLPESGLSVRHTSLSSEQKSGLPNAVSNATAGPPVSSIFNTIHGAAQVLGDDLSRHVVCNSEVLEMSVDTQSIICVARLVLLNDLLIVAYKQPGRSGETQFRIQALYSLENVTLVTTVPKDRRHFPPNAFKLNVSNITRMFKAENATAKQCWMRLIEETKRSFSASQSEPANKPVVPDSINPPSDSTAIEIAASPHAPESDIPSFAIPTNRASAEAVRDTCRALASTLPECAELLTPAREPSDLSSGRRNPFVASTITTSCESSSIGPDKEPLAWLWAIPEDLDVVISERDFTQATDLIVKARRTIGQLVADEATKGNRFGSVSSSRSDLASLVSRIDRNEANLTEALQHELITAADRHGAPQSVASAIVNLSRLGKAALGAQLFLLYRSSLLAKSLTRGIRQEGNQLIYLNRLSFTFHRGLAETSVEWRNIVVNPLIEQSRNHDGVQPPLSEKDAQSVERLLSLRFCGWILEEAHKFGDQLRDLLADNRSISFATLTSASQRIMAHAEKITSLLDVDIVTTIQARLIPTWKKAVETQSLIINDTVETRAKEESWEQVSSQQAQQQEKELYDLGLIRRSADSSISLTSGSFHFIRSLSHFIQNCLRLQCSDIEPTVSRCVANILQTELKNYEQVLNNPQFQAQKPIVNSNLEILVQQVMPKLMKQINGSRYLETREVGRSFKDLLSRINTSTTNL